MTKLQAQPIVNHQPFVPQTDAANYTDLNAAKVRDLPDRLSEAWSG